MNYNSYLDKSYDINFLGIWYNIKLEIGDLNLKFSIKEKYSLNRWVNIFNKDCIENLTRESGNEKSFTAFIKMIISALEKSNNKLSFDILNIEQLNLIRAKITNDNSNNLENKIVKQNSNNISERKYFILNYITEFDKANYPLALFFNDNFTVIELKKICKELYNSLPNKNDKNIANNNDNIDIVILQQKYDNICEENNLLNQKIVKLEERNKINNLNAVENDDLINKFDQLQKENALLSAKLSENIEESRHKEVKLKQEYNLLKKDFEQIKSQKLQKNNPKLYKELEKLKEELNKKINSENILKKKVLNLQKELKIKPGTNISPAINKSFKPKPKSGMSINKKNSPIKKNFIANNKRNISINTKKNVSVKSSGKSASKNSEFSIKSNNTSKNSYIPKYKQVYPNKNINNRATPKKNINKIPYPSYSKQNNIYSRLNNSYKSKSQSVKSKKSYTSGNNSIKKYDPTKYNNVKQIKKYNSKNNIVSKINDIKIKNRENELETKQIDERIKKLKQLNKKI